MEHLLVTLWALPAAIGLGAVVGLAGLYWHARRPGRRAADEAAWIAARAERDWEGRRRGRSDARDGGHDAGALGRAPGGVGRELTEALALADTYQAWLAENVTKTRGAGALLAGLGVFTAYLADWVDALKGALTDRARAVGGTLRWRRGGTGELAEDGE